MPKGVYDRSKVKKTEKTATTVPVKVEVKADPLNLQVTVDPASLEKATAIIQERCRDLASHFEIPGDQVNPFEALFLIADLQKEMMMELKEIRKALTPPTVIKSSISTPVPWGTGDPSLREPR
jgi:hypothetical protein